MERTAGSWNPILTICAAIGIVAMYIVPQLVYILYCVLTGQIDPHNPTAKPDPLLIAQALDYIPVAVYMAAVTPALALVPLRDLGFRVPGARDLAIAFGGAIAMSIAVNGAGTAMQAITHQKDTEAAVKLLQELTSPGEKVLFFAVAVVLAPMIEEFIFRVFVFNSIARFGPVWLAAIVSGIAFGAVHASAPSEFLTVSIPLAMGGIVLAYVYSYTKNYWASVITHGVFNSISVVAILFFKAS